MSRVAAGREVDVVVAGDGVTASAAGRIPKLARGVALR
jgi:hypothetical protein